MAKRYYWLKLKEDFFRDRDIKKLRSMAGGDTLAVIYLEMLLLSLKSDGKLEYTGLEEDFPSEIALTIDENPDNVASVVNFLTKRGLLVECNTDEYELTAHRDMVGSECESAERVRAFRERRMALHCNSTVTGCNTEKEKDRDQEKRNDDDRRGAISDSSTPAAPGWIDSFQKECGWILDDLAIGCIRRCMNEGMTADQIRFARDQTIMNGAEDENRYFTRTLSNYCLKMKKERANKREEK